MSLLAKALVGLTIAVSACAAPSQPLTIVVPSEILSSSAAFAEMRKEAARLIAPADYAPVWVPKSAATGESFEQLVVVRFRGACSPQAEDESVPTPRQSESLATTAVSGGRVLPFVDVDCNRTRRVIAAALAPLPSGARDKMLGRALGRVLAHELYHVLAQTVEHQAGGVSKPCFGMADLLTSRFQFDAVSLAQMRPAAQLARQQVAPAAPAEVVADDAAAGR